MPSLPGPVVTAWWPVMTHVLSRSAQQPAGRDLCSAVAKPGGGEHVRRTVPPCPAFRLAENPDKLGLLLGHRAVSCSCWSLSTSSLIQHSTVWSCRWLFYTWRHHPKAGENSRALPRDRLALYTTQSLSYPIYKVGFLD